jgi:hypothetical protein
LAASFAAGSLLSSQAGVVPAKPLRRAMMV